MTESSRAIFVFADVQQDMPQYLCMDDGGFYICTVGQQDGGYVERDVKRISSIEALVFIANTCNKARMFISENENVEE